MRLYHSEVPPMRCAAAIGHPWFPPGEVGVTDAAPTIELLQRHLQLLLYQSGSMPDNLQVFWTSDH